MARQPTEPQPEPFFTVRISRRKNSPTLSGLCVGYERGVWRAEKLAEHVFEWLPEFSLSFTERQSLRHQNSVRLLRRAAATVYRTEKFKKRGEFGELLLHAAMRQVFNSNPAISKIFYKSSHNETVKGFDAVHVVGDAGSLELWLGEAKFYANYKQAAAAVVKEIKIHSDSDYLRDEFALILNKVDNKWPHAAELARLLSGNVSLDEVFTRTCIPVLLTYDSECLSRHTKCGDDYAKAFVDEIKAHHDDFSSRELPADLRVHLFLLPVKCKEELVKAFNARLKSWQNI